MLEPAANNAQQQPAEQPADSSQAKGLQPRLRGTQLWRIPGQEQDRPETVGIFPLGAG